MGNILAVLKRDLIRLLKGPSALIVLIAIVILPSAYTWYNVAAFWDPYEETGHMRVGVVNLDQGGESELTGSLNVGQSVVENLEDNDKLAWAFLDYDTAMDELKAGESYAVFVIPEDFTHSLLSVTSGDFQQPVVQYYVNEKAGPVSPKITDSGSNTLEETINSEFVATVSDTVVESLVGAFDESTAAANAARSKAIAGLDEALAGVTETRQALASVDAGLSRAQGKKDEAQAALATARDALEDTSKDLDEVSKASADVQKDLVAVAPEASAAMTEGVNALNKLAGLIPGDDYAKEIAKATSGLQECADIITGRMIPSAAKGAGNLSSASSQLSAAATNQQALIDQAGLSLDQLDALIADSRDTLSETDELLAGLESDLRAARADISALSLAGLYEALGVEEGEIDPSKISEFMGSPTTIRTEEMYSLNCYGAGMAPLFMSLTFWIGAFMFLVVCRQEVDDEGVRNLTVTQRYVSRFLFFSVPALLQGIVCCIGVMALGVAVTNPPALFVASALCSLTYLCIIYALSLMFQHIGKGLCILLVFLQIPAATGLYPIEMTADFYQAISPLFPFTYGIGALREAICGFYGTQYLECLGALVAYFLAFAVIGLTVHPLLANVNRMVAHQVAETGLMNGERVEVPARKYRVAHMVNVMVDRSGFSELVMERYGRFLSRYPFMVRTVFVVGLGLPLVLGIILAVLGVDRVVVLTIWLLSFLLLIVVLTALETFRSGLGLQMDLSNMEEDEVRKLYLARNDMHQTRRFSFASRRFVDDDTDEFAVVPAQASGQTDARQDEGGEGDSRA